jgi:hypothetical protein
MSASAPASYLPWDDHAAWDALALKEKEALQRKCSKCSVCGDYLPPTQGVKDQGAYEMCSQLKKCGCCYYCASRARTTESLYSGTQCVSAARQTLCFLTKEERQAEFDSVKRSVVARGVMGRPCKACCNHFGFVASKK